MDDVSTQDILVVLIQKEKTIAMLMKQVQTIAKENERLHAELAEAQKKIASMVEQS